MLRILLLTAALLTVSTALTNVTTDSSPTQPPAPKVQRKCGDAFNYGLDKIGSRQCYTCPHGNLARMFGMPVGIPGRDIRYRDICYDRFEVTTSLICTESATTRINCSVSHGRVNMISTRNFVRYETVAADDVKVQVAPSAKLQFIFASYDAKEKVERFVIWKKKGCETTKVQYECSVGRNLPPTGQCWIHDEGEYAIVTCDRMISSAFTIHINSPVTLCHIPAEVEVYGTRSVDD